MPVILFVVFIDLVGFGVIVPLLPFYGEHFHASALMVTALMAVYSGAQLLSAPLWGRWSDRIGRRPVILISLTTSVLAYLWFSGAEALWMLFAARVVQGLSAGNISAAQAYIADITAPDKRARGMGMLGAAIGLGFMLGPLIGGWFAGADPAHVAVAPPALVAAGLSACALITAAVTLRESLPAGRRAIPAVGRWRQLRQALARPALRAPMLLFFTTTFAFAGMETTVALWAEHRFGWGPWRVGTMFGLIGIVMIIIQGGLTGRLTRRYGEARLLLAGTILIGPGLVLMAVGMTPFLGVLGVGLIACGNGMTSPATAALISRAAGANEQGGVLGLNQSMGALARLTGPVTAGLAWEALGTGGPSLLGALVMLVSAGLAFRLSRGGR